MKCYQCRFCHRALRQAPPRMISICDVKKSEVVPIAKACVKGEEARLKP